MDNNSPDFRLIAFPAAYLYEPTYNFGGPVSFDWFTYMFPLFPAIPLAGTNTQQVIIQNDSDFELRRIVYHEDIAAAAYTDSARPIPNCTILITDSGSGRNLMSNPVPLSSIACFGDNPVDLPWPKIFTRNSTIQVAITNFDAAVTPNIRLSFQGRKIFPM